VSVATNSHRDRLRRGKREERHASAIAALAEMSPWVQGAIASSEIARGWKDDLLRLIFACCHPVLEAGESAGLALATVLGLSSAEIAQAFAVAPRSMDQRLTRARRRLREHGDYEAPHPERAGERVGAVLAVLWLLFNEGYWSGDEAAPIRGDLCRLAIGLGRSLREAFPSDPEVLGLLSLMVLHEARRPARTDVSGAPLPLSDQDRSRWDADAIAEGTALLEAALTIGAPGPFQMEAAISATHCRARTAADTDWKEIAELYALLERARPSAGVRVNRAFVVGKAQGASAGLALLDTSVAGYPTPSWCAERCSRSLDGPTTRSRRSSALRRRRGTHTRRDRFASASRASAAGSGHELRREARCARARAAFHAGRRRGEEDVRRAVLHGEWRHVLRADEE
jgi:RNA polymerase sigma-70 factor (ECF subfamily)